VTLASFACALIAGGLMGYTAMLGGQVRHTEIRPSATARVVEDLHVDEQEDKQ